MKTVQFISLITMNRKPIIKALDVFVVLLLLCAACNKKAVEDRSDLELLIPDSNKYLNWSVVNSVDTFGFKSIYDNVIEIVVTASYTPVSIKQFSVFEKNHLFGSVSGDILEGELDERNSFVSQFYFNPKNDVRLQYTIIIYFKYEHREIALKSLNHISFSKGYSFHKEG